MRDAPLTMLKGGIDRRRLKGGARADALYDLLNGYVNEEGTAQVRQGTARIARLSSLTRGLCAFDGTLHTFCHEQVYVPEGFTLNLIVHPEALAGYPIRLSQIHYAEPFMGSLYVVAEFEEGSVYHYWLQPGTVWEPNHHYTHGAFVAPSVPNGLVYRATRLGNAYPSWAPNVSRSDGTGDYEQSIVEPTTYNEFYYTCVQTQGDNPRSGSTEPTWPTEDGAQITETVEDEDDYSPPTVTAPPSTDQPTEEIKERYYRGVRIPG